MKSFGCIDIFVCIPVSYEKKFQYYVLCICGSILNYFWTYWTISNGFDRQNRGLKDNYITTVFMKIGSQVEEGDLQVSQPKEGLQSKFRSYWTQVEPCKCFPKRKVSTRACIFLETIPRVMANPWETRQLVLPLEKLPR